MPTAAQDYQQKLDRLAQGSGAVEVVGSKEFQAHVHYHWEALIRPEFTMILSTLPKIQGIANDVARLYKRVPPRISFSNRIKFPVMAATPYKSNDIYFVEGLPPTMGVLLHELAHVINNTDDPFGDLYMSLNGGHSPRFIGTVIDLYTHVAGANRELLEHQAKMMGVGFNYSGRPG